MTTTEIVATQVLQDGAPFIAHITYSHIPTMTMPGVDDLNNALLGLGQGQSDDPGMTIDSITPSAAGMLLSDLTLGVAVDIQVTCHVSNGGNTVMGGQLTQWLTQAFLLAENAFSITGPVVQGLVTVSGASSSGGLLGSTMPVGTNGQPNPAANPPSPATPWSALTWVAIAIIAVVLFVGGNEIKNSL